MASTRKADQSERSPPPSREFYEGMAASSSSRVPEVGNPSPDGAVRKLRPCGASRASDLKRTISSAVSRILRRHGSEFIFQSPRSWKSFAGWSCSKTPTLRRLAGFRSKANDLLRRLENSTKAWQRVHLPESQKLEILRRMELFENSDPAAPRGLPI